MIKPQVMKTCTTAQCFNYNSNTNLLARCVFVHVMKCVECVFISNQKYHNKIHTHAHPLIHTKLFSCYQELDWVISFIFLLSCSVWVSCIVSPKLHYTLYKWLCIWFFPEVETMKHSCILHCEVWFWRYFTTPCLGELERWATKSNYVVQHNRCCGKVTPKEILLNVF